MRKFLNSLVSPFGLEVSRKKKPINKKYFALNELDKKLERYLPKSNGFFVELGANNGIDQSNTLYFEVSKGWRGVLIEPVVHNYFMCRENRSTSNKIYCNACVSFEYEEKFVPISYANLMTTPLIDSSDIIDRDRHIQNAKPFLKRYEDSVIFGAAARTLNDILIDAGAPSHIDLLSLDVEGAELEVLRGIDFNAYSFEYMCIECRDINRLSSYLDSFGYKNISQLSVHDYLFLKI